MSKLTENTNRIQGLLNDISALPKDRYEEGLAKGTSLARSIIDRSVTEITEADLVGATSIGDYAFYRCQKLKSTTLPDTIVSIGDYAFLNCSAMISVTFLGVVTRIGAECFSGCADLESIILPEGLTSIGRTCFASTKALKTLTIPSTVTDIGSKLLQNSGVTTLYVMAITPPTIISTTFLNASADLNIYVPAESLEVYKSATNWSAYADRIFAIEE